MTKQSKPRYTARQTSIYRMTEGLLGTLMTMTERIPKHSCGVQVAGARAVNEVLSDIGRKGFFSLDDAYTLAHYQSSLNSYLGFMHGKNTYAIRRKVFNEHCPLFFNYFYMDGRYEVVRVRKEYSLKFQLLKHEDYEYN